MPTTATVAPRPVFTGGEIASGFRALADLFDRKPWIAGSIRLPSVPQHISIGLKSRDDVEALAADHHTRVKVDEGGAFVSTEVTFDGLRASFYAVIDEPRTLRRDPEATAILAERDA